MGESFTHNEAVKYWHPLFGIQLRHTEPFIGVDHQCDRETDR